MKLSFLTKVTVGNVTREAVIEADDAFAVINEVTDYVSSIPKHATINELSIRRIDYCL